MMKRIFAFLLTLAMVCALLPLGNVQAEAAGSELTPADYAEVDLVFDQIEAKEDVCATRNATQKQITDAAAEIVAASDSYVEGSLERNGDSFSWWTDSGIRCIYSPRMEKISDNFVPENSIDEIVNEPRITKGGSPSSNQVYLIGPYYGIDENFTDQYKNEAKRIAAAYGDTDGYTLYSGKSATVDKVAQAVSNGAVVLFDSHGATDYESGYDYVSGATSSYICLNNTSGLTSADYAAGAGYGSDGTAFINGQTIANHMTKNSPGGFVWMATCLGMATNTMCNPLRNMGVEVVYGYSQSVTFAGDYLFEEAFWDAFLKDGTTVKQAITTMKNTWGNWDWSTKIANYYGYNDGYSTISSARSDYAAFPIVVSDEDAHPGQRYRTSNWGADIIQTVNSTYTVGEPPVVTVPTEPEVPAVDGATLSFRTVDARQELDGTIQVWSENGITFTNEQSGSSTPVADYFNPVRIYASSTVTIAAKNMYKLDIDCSGLGDKYVNAWTNTLSGQGINYTKSSGIITVTLDAPADSLTLDSMSAQARAYAITVYIAESETQPTVPETQPTVPETEPTAPETEPTVPETEPTQPVQPQELTLDFSNAANRESWNASQQTWKQNGVTLVNDKANSSSEVANYVNPARFYKNSKLTISAENMVQIVFNCNTSSYATALKNAIAAASGVTVAVSNKAVTVSFAQATDSFVIEALSGGQVRMDSLVVTVAVQTPVEMLPGDFSQDGQASNADVVALVWHVLFPADNPISGNADLNNDGSVDNNDVIILIWYVLFPELYPLPN